MLIIVLWKTVVVYTDNKNMEWKWSNDDNVFKIASNKQNKHVHRRVKSLINSAGKSTLHLYT